MGSWERLKEILLLDKKAFNSKSNLEDSTVEEYTHYKKSFKELGLKNLGDYHDLYVQCDTFLFAVYSKTLEISVLKYMNLTPLFFYQLQN